MIWCSETALKSNDFSGRAWVVLISSSAGLLTSTYQRTQSQEAVNSVFSTEADHQDIHFLEKEEPRTSDKRYRKSFAAWWPLYRVVGGFLEKAGLT